MCIVYITLGLLYGKKTGRSTGADEFSAVANNDNNFISSECKLHHCSVAAAILP